MSFIQGVGRGREGYQEILQDGAREEVFFKVWKNIVSYLPPADRWHFAMTCKRGYRVVFEVEKERLPQLVEQCVRVVFSINAMLQATRMCSSLSKASLQWEQSKYHELSHNDPWVLDLLAVDTKEGFNIVTKLSHLQEMMGKAETLQELYEQNKAALLLLNQAIFHKGIDPWFLPCFQRMLSPLDPRTRLLMHAFYHDWQGEKEIEDHDLQAMVGTVMPYVRTKDRRALEQYFLGPPEDPLLYKEKPYAKRRNFLPGALQRSAEGTPFAWDAHDLMTWQYLVRRLAKKDSFLEITKIWLQERIQDYTEVLLCNVPENEGPYDMLHLVEQLAASVTSPSKRSKMLLDLWVKQISSGLVAQFWHSLVTHVKNKSQRETDGRISRAIVLLAIIKPPKEAEAIPLLLGKISSLKLRQQLSAFWSHVQNSPWSLQPDPKLIEFSFKDYIPDAIPDDPSVEEIDVDIKKEFQALIRACNLLENSIIRMPQVALSENHEMILQNKKIWEKRHSLIQSFVGQLNLLSDSMLQRAVKEILGDRTTGPYILGLLGFPPQEAHTFSRLEHCFLQKIGLYGGSFRLDMKDTLAVATKFASIRGEAQKIYFPLALELLQRSYQHHKGDESKSSKIVELVIQGHLDLFPDTSNKPDLRKHWLASIRLLAHPGLVYGFETEPDLPFLKLLFQKLKMARPKEVLPVFCELIAICPRYDYPSEWEGWLSLARLPIWQAPIDKRNAQRAIFQRLFSSCPSLAKMPRKTWPCLLHPTVFHTIFPEPEYDFDFDN